MNADDQHEAESQKQVVEATASAVASVKTTAIEWTDATWNPTTGCSVVSPGCANCYAETLSLRFGWSKKPWTPENAAENVILHPERLGKPLSWRAPRRVFVNSMSDLFHELIPFEYVDLVFETMATADQHTYQILTKRPERMRDYMLRGADSQCEPLPNVWLGTSIENDRHAFRADVLRETPAAVRFISAEPLLGPVPSLDLDGIDWLIVGGESGSGHRYCDVEWVRALRDNAAFHDTAFFFKQWGGRTPKSGGRLLDGREWSEYPHTPTAQQSAPSSSSSSSGRSPREAAEATVGACGRRLL